MTEQELVAETIRVRETAFAPFSNFKVGATLLADDGEIYRGCNIEISSYGLTLCAERVAIFKAFSEGARNFTSIFIASDSDRITPPCGACRQVLWELAGDIEVVMVDRNGNFEKRRMSELLPLGFDKSYLTNK